MAVINSNLLMAMETSKSPQAQTHRYGTRFAAASIAKYGVDIPCRRQPLVKPQNYSNTRLANGHALGNVRFTTHVNGLTHTLKCTADCIGGRGLRVYDPVGKGVILARGSGTIVSYDRAAQEVNAFKIYDTKKTFLLLGPPTIAMPAHLANTSNGDRANNCRITHKAGTNYFNIVTLRPLEAGEEVTVAYGSKFTAIVRKNAKDADLLRKVERTKNCNMLIQCNECQTWIVKRLFKKHNKLICDCIKRKNSRKLRSSDKVKLNSGTV